MDIEARLAEIVDNHTSPDFEYGEHKPVDAYAVAEEVAEMYKARIESLQRELEEARSLLAQTYRTLGD